MSDVVMPKITAYYKWTEWETDGNGDTVGDEPTTVDEEEETFDCYPSDYDRSEGLTAADLAVLVLQSKLYVTETSAYPWQPGSWYVACHHEDYSPDKNGAHKDVTAHLEGFTPQEERAIFEAVSKNVPSMR